MSHLQGRTQADVTQQRAALPDRKPHIGIVGAGLSGLRCADILLQHGFQVTILEGREQHKDQARDLAKRLLGLCEDRLEAARALLESLQSVYQPEKRASGTSSNKNIVKLLRKAKVSYLQISLGSLSGTIALLVQAIHYAEAKEAGAPNGIL